MVPAFYINLDRDVDRRLHIEQELAQPNLWPIRVRALGPLSPHGIFEQSISAGEIGAYASHMKAWSTLLASDHPYALIVEDDACVPTNLGMLAQSIIRALPNDWDLVHLYDDENRPARAICPIDARHELVRYSRAPRGCVGYLVSRSGAQKLSRHEMRCWPVDTDFRRPWHFGLESYGVRPAPIGHTNDFASAVLSVGPRSRARRGIKASNPLHSLQGAIWNIRRLGLSWWLYAAAVNASRRIGRAIGKQSESLVAERQTLTPNARRRTSA